MSAQPSRRDLMRPVQLLGLAFVAALFAGIVTLVSMGFFQARPADEIQRAVVLALIVAGVTFIVTLVIIALLVLAVDPTQVTRTVDRPLLLPPDPAEGASSAPAAPSAPAVPPAAAGAEAPAVPPELDTDAPRDAPDADSRPR